MHIDPFHPRAASLKVREKLVWGVKKGLTSTAGLLAHGRGEAFDYLLGEKTHDFALKAIDAAAAYLLLAKKPVISTNGNSIALAASVFIKLAKLLNCKIEVNLFHYSQKRQLAIENYLQHLSKSIVLDSVNSATTVIPHITSHRKIAFRDGIAQADVILVPLEDGDRCEALVRLGKKVVTVDLNPLSRTSQYATVTIVDNIVRTMPLLCQAVKELRNKPKKYLMSIVEGYKNTSSLSAAMKTIVINLSTIHPQS